MARDAAGRIERHKRGREPVLMARKYARMKSSPFVFFRGSCHLFHQDWPSGDKIDHAPAGWLSGDLHLENFGVYKGDDRLVYFDLNDFDEALLAPCTRELARFVTSVLLAGAEAGVSTRRTRELAAGFIDQYRAALAQGRAGRIEPVTATGPVRKLLDAAAQRTRVELLDRRTELRKGRRQIRIDGEHALPASADERRHAKLLLRAFTETGLHPPLDAGLTRDYPRGFFRVLDVARRVAGTGSLGVARYVVLVEGRGSPDRNHLFDLKAALPSAGVAYTRQRQPKWPNEAQRLVGVQRRAQAVSPAFLGAATADGGASFVLRELQPVEDRLDFDRLYANGGADGGVESALIAMAHATAWSHLRSSGRQGSAIADEWIAFGRREKWVSRVLEYACDYRKQVERDWKAFRKAMLP